MSDTKTTDEKIFSMKWKNFIPLILGIVVSTNTVNSILHIQSASIEKIEYNDKAQKRRLSNGIRELEYKMKIISLEKELEDCVKN